MAAQVKAEQLPPLRVWVETTPGERQLHTFNKKFRIGRSEDCELRISNEFVSRVHAEVDHSDSQWQVRDLGSSNGLFVNRERRTQVPLVGETSIRLGIDGPTLLFEVGQVSAREPMKHASDTIVARYVDRYFAQSGGNQPAGEHTMIVRRAFSLVQKKQAQKHAQFLTVLGLLVIVVGAYAAFLHFKTSKQRAMAEELFYAMKEVDVNIANIERLIDSSGVVSLKEQTRRLNDRRREMEGKYNDLLASMRVYDEKLTPRQRLVLRITRIFGECELAMPDDFAAEIDRYIERWKSSGRLTKAIRTAKANGYARTITQELLAKGLPPQFFYLAVQESALDPYASGPGTNKGIAKGMWQFIPETGAKYGLRIGPLVDLPRPDPGDDRHEWQRATKAATQYIKDLYSTDAEASGLLVMACYNWGESRVLPLVRSMPANPKDRNFWRLLERHKEKLPQETYEYVFSIVSAAVIGEEPSLFGFEWDNPLAAGSPH